MFSGDPPLGIFSDDEDGILESIVFGDYDEEQQQRKKRQRVVLAAAAGYIAHCEDAMCNSRAPAFCRERLNWEKHVQTYLSERGESFKSFYRMSHVSFLKLADMLRPHLQGNVAMAKLRTGGNDIISTEMNIHCVLRFLSWDE